MFTAEVAPILNEQIPTFVERQSRLALVAEITRFKHFSTEITPIY